MVGVLQQEHEILLLPSLLLLCMQRDKLSTQLLRPRAGLREQQVLAMSSSVSLLNVALQIHSKALLAVLRLPCSLWPFG